MFCSIAFQFAVGNAIFQVEEKKTTVSLHVCLLYFKWYKSVIKILLPLVYYNIKWMFSPHNLLNIRLRNDRDILCRHLGHLSCELFSSSSICIVHFLNNVQITCIINIIFRCPYKFLWSLRIIGRTYAKRRLG